MRLPRMTMRRWMVLVAIVAAGCRIWLTLESLLFETSQTAYIYIY